MTDVLITPASGVLAFTASNDDTIGVSVSGSVDGVSLVFDASSGSLFRMTDTLSGTLSSINNASGLPVFEAFSDDRIIFGEFGQDDFHLSGNMVGIGDQPQAKLYVSGGGGNVPNLFIVTGSEDIKLETSNGAIDLSAFGNVSTWSVSQGPLAADLDVLNLETIGNVNIRLNSGKTIRLVADTAITLGATSGSITFTTGTAGELELQYSKWPKVEGGVNQALTTDGAGQLSWQTLPSASMTNTNMAYHDTTHDPVALWQFSGSLTDEIDGANLSVGAGTERYATMGPGMIGAYLDGGTSLNRAATGSLQLLGALTVECIIRLSDPAPDTTNNIFNVGDVGETEATNSPYSMQYLGDFQLQYFAEQGGGGNIVNTFQDTVLSNGDIHHLALTRDSAGTDLNIYIDGRRVANGTASSAPTGGTSAFINVGSNPNPADYGEFTIASLKIIASELTAAQILEEYERTVGLHYRSFISEEKFTSNTKSTTYTGSIGEIVKYTPINELTGSGGIAFPPNPASDNTYGFKNVSSSSTGITINGDGINIENPSTYELIPSATLSGDGVSIGYKYDLENNAWLIV